MVVLAGRAAADESVAQARAEGPVILEMVTYRYRGHSMSDPAKYRTREEVNKFRAERDPIEHLREILIDEGHADEDRLKQLDREIREGVADAAEFAQNSPETDPSELYTEVLAPASPRNGKTPTPHPYPPKL